MKLKTKEIRAAALEYQKNRRLPNWNKEADAENLFTKMAQAGLIGLSATAGTFSGRNPNCKSKPIFVIDIGETVFMKSFKDFDEYWNYVKLAKKG